MRIDNICFTAPTLDSIPRPLVIDGCNIGRSASGYARTHVDCAGLVAVIRWLMFKGFDVIVFLPVVYNNVNNYNARNAELLHKLERLGIVTFTPARSGRGLRKAFINYDDLYVASYASRHGGCILSGDKFKDILQQSCYSDFHEVIRYRTVDVKFRPIALDFVEYKGDFFYKQVPELYIYENLNLKNDILRRKLHATPNEPDFQLVRTHRNLLTRERRAFLCSELDSLMMAISLAAGKAFRHVDFLPFTDTLPLMEDLRIEEVMDAGFCEQFYEIYPQTNTNVDPVSPYVMEPVVDVTDKKLRRILETLDREEDGAIMNAENEVLLDSELLIDLGAENSEAPPAPKKLKLPMDLSCSSLLEWFILAEKEKEN